MELSDNAIKEIAEYLDCGLICYINRDTKEIKSLIDPDNVYAEEEHWKEDLEEIENNWENFVKIEKMSSREAFRLMENFTSQVSNIEIRNRLVHALNRNKPFKNFKYEVDYDETVRQEWFKYKANKYEEWVREYLENIEDEKKDKLNVVGYYNDDGSAYNPNLFPLPNLCVSCKKKDDPNEEMFCNLTRMDQFGESEFRCFAYEKLINHT